MKSMIYQKISIGFSPTVVTREAKSPNLGRVGTGMVIMMNLILD